MNQSNEFSIIVYSTPVMRLELDMQRRHFKLLFSSNAIEFVFLVKTEQVLRNAPGSSFGEPQEQ